MVQKKIDSRIPALIRNSVQTRERGFIVMVGDKSRNQLPNLHYLLSSADLNGNKQVLWAYKKKLLGFTSHRKKREAKIKREIKRGQREVNQQDPFELFISLQQIRYVYYKETDKILGNTYGMLILQDFEAMTPNILARTIETVAGGGLVVLLLQSMSSLKQLYSMSMDVHSRYRTEAKDDVVGRFNERFILSLGSNRNCLVVDDELNVLPISGAKGIEPLPVADPAEAASQNENADLTELIASLEGVPTIYPLVKMCKTLDQAKAILTFVDAVTDNTLRQTVALTAGRGRGKSAAMGLAIASAISHGYSNIFITSPSPENLKTLFEFVFKGFDSLGLEEHQDYDIIQSTNPEFNKAIVRVNVFKTHRQTLQWIQPSDAHVLGQAELLVIDEAAAIPLPLVKKLLGPYLVFMASTINGYEGTGRSLSLKLLSQLRTSNTSDRKLREVSLSEPIRYASGDPVEKWLNKLLCLDATTNTKGGAISGFPHPEECELYSINRNTLFSFHPVSEAFLHKVMGLYVASHYKNSPNDLQLLSDAPAHQLYVLLAPRKQNGAGAVSLPEPLCVIQVALEGRISRGSMASSLAAGQRGGGDLIPWVVSQQFQDTEFATLSGGRIVRIATNPDYVGMGYGARAMDQLARFFKGELTPLREGVELFQADFETDTRISDEEISGGLQEELKTRDPKTMPPLLMRLSEMQPEPLDYLGVSYGMTQSLFRFWKRQHYLPLYLRQTTNDLTGEHTSIMVKTLREPSEWLSEFSKDFSKRFIELLSFNFKEFPAVQALVVLQSIPKPESPEDDKVAKSWLDKNYSPFDLKRLESYAVGRIDHHVITDLVPSIAKAYFQNVFGPAVELSGVQQAVLLGMGLQKKDVGEVGVELNLPTNQALAMFSKTMRKVSTYFRTVLSNEINSTLPEIKDGLDDRGELVAHKDACEFLVQERTENESMGSEDTNVNPASIEVDADEELDEDHHKKRELINSLNLDRYAISPDAEFDDDTVRKGAQVGRVAVKIPSKKRRESIESIYKEEMAAVTRAKKQKGKASR